ncbi:Ionotropic receptor 113 [Frankliniella occidentalis]|nr:Ionotropic receptor 113 [Frankliniella occidentalis]
MALLVQLVLLLLIGVLCWAGARAALHPVVTSPAPGAECVASFVASILPPDNSWIIVHGDAQLVGRLLQELQDLGRGAQTLVMDPRDMPSHMRFLMRFTVSLYVIAAVSPVHLSTLTDGITDTASLASGMVLWTRTSSLDSALLRDQVDRGRLLWVCERRRHLIVSAPNGTTVYFSPDIGESCVMRWSDLKVTEMGRCEPGHRGWQGPRWPRLCSRWKSPEPGKTASQFLCIKPNIRSSHHQIADLNPYYDTFYKYASILTTAVSRRMPVELSFVERGGSELMNSTVNCSLAAALLRSPVSVGPSPYLEYDSFFMAPIIVVVPAGAGPRLDPLRAVTAEFSAELWVATALALLFMTAAAAVAWTTLGRPPLAALAAASLQTLAPLLAQSPPGRTAHRPLSAVWLLMSVVLAAAYQGLLLRELTSPPPEINSLEQLEQSGLDIYAEEGLHLIDSFRYMLSHSLKSRMHYFNTNTNYTTVLERVVDGRNSALICCHSTVNALTLSHLSNRVHLFTLPNSTSLMASVMYTRGSPFAKSLHSVISWFVASALQMHIITLADFRLTLDAASKDTASELAHPLSLGQLQPAFCLLAAGCVLSAIVFVVEVLCHKWSLRHHAPPVPVFLH